MSEAFTTYSASQREGRPKVSLIAAPTTLPFSTVARTPRFRRSVRPSASVPSLARSPDFVTDELLPQKDD